MGKTFIPRGLHSQCRSDSEVRIKIAGDYTWFPLHPPLRDVDPAAGCEEEAKIASLPAARFSIWLETRLARITLNDLAIA